MAIIIPAAVLAAPAVCHMMRAKQEEEEKINKQSERTASQELKAKQEEEE